MDTAVHQAGGANGRGRGPGAKCGVGAERRTLCSLVIPFAQFRAILNQGNAYRKRLHESEGIFVN